MHEYFAHCQTDLYACAQWTIISAYGGGDFARFASWLAQGIRTGHKLGLHTLTSDPETMPPDDPALPPGKNSMKREMALKLWGFMIFFECVVDGSAPLVLRPVR